MWRRIIVFLVTFSLALLQVEQKIGPSYLFFIFPFAFLLFFYLLIMEDRISSVMVVVFFLFSVVHGAQETQDPMYLLLILMVGIASYSIFLYRRRWNKRIKEAEKRKQSMDKEVEALLGRHQARKGSLRHLEEQVDGLIHLFEIARNFNECLDFSELLSILDHKIVPEVSFSRGTMILLDSGPSSEKQVSYCFPFGSKKREGGELTEPFARECLKMVTLANHVVKIELPTRDEKNRLVSYHTEFPLWLFPLSVEQQLIAVFAIEGAKTNDFQKFEILASQLALQVKKVLLYETVKATSIVDGLTNVFVRRHFLERFQEELRRAFRYRFPLSVLMVDVDHFKSYNDQFGHLVGDRTLREVAQVIRDNVRRVDIIGRYGGEEFIIVAPEIARAQGLELAERIRSMVARKRLQLYDEETQVTVSIGVSSFPEDVSAEPLSEFLESHLSALIQKADEALYRAKEEGRNRIAAYGA